MATEYFHKCQHEPLGPGEILRVYRDGTVIGDWQARLRELENMSLDALVEQRAARRAEALQRAAWRAKARETRQRKQAGNRERQDALNRLGAWCDG